MSTVGICHWPQPIPEPPLSPCFDTADLLSLLFLPVQSSLFTLLWAEFLSRPVSKTSREVSINSEWPSYTCIWTFVPVSSFSFQNSEMKILKWKFYFDLAEQFRFRERSATARHSLHDFRLECRWPAHTVHGIVVIKAVKCQALIRSCFCLLFFPLKQSLLS